MQARLVKKSDVKSVPAPLPVPTDLAVIDNGDGSVTIMGETDGNCFDISKSATLKAPQSSSPDNLVASASGMTVKIKAGPNAAAPLAMPLVVAQITVEVVWNDATHGPWRINIPARAANGVVSLDGVTCHVP